MAVLAMIVLTETQKDEALALDTDLAAVNPRQIDNTLADSLGFGTLTGLWVITARTLVDPDYSAWADWFAALNPSAPIHVLDTDTLFVPDPDE